MMRVWDKAPIAGSREGQKPSEAEADCIMKVCASVA